MSGYRENELTTVRQENAKLKSDLATALTAARFISRDLSFALDNVSKLTDENIRLGNDLYKRDRALATLRSFEVDMRYPRTFWVFMSLLAGAAVGATLTWSVLT